MPRRNLGRSMNPSVLIVEDERIVAMELEAQIKSLGYNVLGPASSTLDALSCCDATPPDLALMDIRIPGSQDGIECAKSLRDRFDVPVIYLTAIADTLTIERAKLTEPAGYLIKPVRSDELKAAVEIALFKSQMERGLAQQRSQFVAMLSHDIRNPLQSIAGFAELLAQDLDAAELTHAKEILNRMRESLGHTVKLVADHLTLLGFDPKHGDSTKTYLSLNELLCRLKDRYAGEAMRRNIALHTELAENLPLIESDQLMLERVLANLVFNALKFTPSGGRVILSTTAGADLVQVTVADTGLGIAAEDLPKVFEQGWRGASSEAEAGSGLGLFIVKFLTAALRGRVEVESTEGSGSRFSVFLPRTAASIPVTEGSAQTT